jgi:branched-chain amino acid transport system substrate-binding protein
MTLRSEDFESSASASSAIRAMTDTKIMDTSRSTYSQFAPMRRVAVPLALLCGLGCGPAEPPEVRIGLIGVFSGAMESTSGIPARDGALMAIDQLNADGGILIDGRRHRLVLVERRVENRPDAAAVAARSLINLDSVDVILGPQFSALAIAAAPIAEESEVLMISPMASNPAVTAGRRFVFRLAFLDDFQGEVLARFAAESLVVRRAAVLHDAASLYGRDIAALFARTFASLGGTVVGIETFDVDGGRDYRPQLRRLFAQRPDALLLPNFVTADSSQIYQARDMGFRGVFLGSDSWDVRGLSPREAAIGSVIVANWDRRSSRPAAAAFIAAWNARYTEEPRATGAATYDAVHLVALAMQRAGRRVGGAVADSLRTLGRYEGAVTTYDFVGSNNPRRGAVILEVRPQGLDVRATFGPPTP